MDAKGLRQVTALALIALAAGGCLGDQNPFEMAAVSGKLTYADGSPISAGYVMVRFIPDGIAPVGQKWPKPAEGKLQADGSFSEVSTFRFGDGAIVGRHKVIVEAYNENGSPRPAGIPARYRDPAQSPWTVEVKQDGPNQFHLRVEKSP